LLHNDYLLDFVGKSKTNKIQSEIQKFVLEQKIKSCFNLPMSIIDTHNPFESEILNIGASIPSDLILDNFGYLMDHYIGCVGAVTKMTDIAGVLNSTTLPLSNQNVMNTAGFSQPPSPSFFPLTGTLFKLGSDGVTSPLRTDYNINTPLGSSPENLITGTNDGGYNSGLGTFTASKTFPNAGGSGTIAEMGSFIQQTTGVTLKQYMISHDLISPVVPYVAGQVINVEIVWTV